jgi:hypothetical protein
MIRTEIALMSGNMPPCLAVRWPRGSYTEYYSGPVKLVEPIPVERPVGPSSTSKTTASRRRSTATISRSLVDRGAEPLVVCYA